MHLALFELISFLTIQKRKERKEKAFLNNKRVEKIVQRGQTFFGQQKKFISTFKEAEQRDNATKVMRLMDAFSDTTVLS
jgi:uncharacterized protein YaaR (DUF327 family)